MAGGFVDNLRRLLGWWSSVPAQQTTIFGESVEFAAGRLRTMDRDRFRSIDGTRYHRIEAERGRMNEADRTRLIDDERMP